MLETIFCWSKFVITPIWYIIFKYKYELATSKKSWLLKKISAHFLSKIMKKNFKKIMLLKYYKYYLKLVSELTKHDILIYR